MFLGFLDACDMIMRLLLNSKAKKMKSIPVTDTAEIRRRVFFSPIKSLSSGYSVIALPCLIIKSMLMFYVLLIFLNFLKLYKFKF